LAFRTGYGTIRALLARDSDEFSKRTVDPVGEHVEVRAREVQRDNGMAGKVTDGCSRRQEPAPKVEV
jgi:hypothetical protein